MTIVQNCLTIPITIDHIDNRIELIHSKLKDKKINAIYLLGSAIDMQIKSPYQDFYLSNIYNTYVEDLYLNLIDYRGQKVVENLSFDHGNFTITPTSVFNEYKINHVIDIYNSYLSYSTHNTSSNDYLILFVIYQNEAFIPVNDQINGSITIEIKPTSRFQNIKLRDYVGEQLNGKKIKKIIVKNYETSYLDLYTKNNKRIENIPSFLLKDTGPKEVFFDYLDIDFERSYFKQRGLFVYNPKITFIY